ncbi:bifunctional phosphoribosyl-AMP cyclohydrolase/phosphoribosyl-ATP diphosphatase HisIE [Cellulosilyticum lentocellum]|uniref:Histidine biosynthesis bifunctional protein HisIE n=1 Tax=Cellulosilyticum lentocellum (strain ATCC 49066 / DSM 5427 / NCIMB 11756 / RHM5) TaxID=642492 RepID=F2JGU5_CELLD|nr:bifunctional phosphoribosyl-AMP cyclohydrolase/phosphoribosyl-ATP diphosphatase HisIE [Cellulosilyticum lentocellum]ADZ84187.1 phosphoribosyl-ATP diphosphatase [Cellulosilyticum lentocellum DSM 5427]
MNKKELLKAVKYDEKGLVPVIAQDYHSKKVRMMAYMNEEALLKTLETGKVHYFSRSRQALWLKGETSSHYQYLKQISVDCDGDTLLLQIEQAGGISCHTGNSSCFYRELTEEVVEAEREAVTLESDDSMLGELYSTIMQRKEHPKEGSYTNYLLDKGLNKILKKVGEECTEVIIAAKDEDNKELTFEIADLMYHLTVMMAQKGLTWEEVSVELAQRK